MLSETSSMPHLSGQVAAFAAAGLKKPDISTLSDEFLTKGSEAAAEFQKLLRCSRFECRTSAVMLIVKA